MNELKNFLGRIRVGVAPLLTALVAAMPVLLDQLGVLDLKPILSRFMDPDYASLVIWFMPFVLAFLRPLVSLAEKKVEVNEEENAQWTQ